MPGPRRRVLFCVAVAAGAMVSGALVAGLPQAVAAAGPAAAAATPAPLAPGGSYQPITPARVLDTRGSSATVDRTVTVANSIVPLQAIAVAAQITVLSPSRAGNAAVYPYANLRPTTAASISWDAGRTTTETVLATLFLDPGAVAAGGTSSSFLIHTTSAVQLLVDIEGYFTARAAASDAGTYHYVAPRRIMDTRSGLGGGALGASGTRLLSVGGGGVPSSGVAAVAVNLIQIGASTAGYVTAYDPGQARPHVTSLSLVPGQVRANRLFAPVRNGQIALYNATGTTQLVVEVVGWFGAGAYYHPLEAGFGAEVGGTTVRVADTRVHGSVPQLDDGLMKIGPTDLGIETSMVGRAGSNSTLPPVTMVATVTTFGAAGSGSVTAFADRTARPATTDIPYGSGYGAANLIMSPLTEGTYDLQVSGAQAGFVVDVSGYFVRTVPLTRPGLYGWGEDGVNTAANGNPTETAPVPELSPGTVLAIGAGAGDANYLVRSDHTVWGWGSGPFGAGDRTTGLVQVPGATGVTAVAALAGNPNTAPRAGAALALGSDGSVLAWGHNDFGQLGNGTRIDRVAPGPVPGLTGIVAIAADQTAGFALDGTGSVWGWGDNSSGQLAGATTAGDSTTPIKLAGLSDVTAISADADEAWAVTSTGQVWHWGLPAHSRAQSDQTLRRYDPTGICPARKVVAGDINVVVLYTDGTVWAADQPHFVSSDVNGPTAGLTGVTDVWANVGAGYALAGDGQVWDWSYAEEGLIGNGWLGAPLIGDPANYDASILPAPVNGLNHIVAIGGSDSATYVVRGN